MIADVWDFVAILLVLMLLVAVIVVPLVSYVLLFAMAIAAVSELATEVVRGYYSLATVVVVSIAVVSVIVALHREWLRARAEAVKAFEKAPVTLDLSVIVQMVLVGSIYVLPLFGLQVPERFASIFSSIFPIWVGINILYIILQIVLLYIFVNK